MTVHVCVCNARLATEHNITQANITDNSVQQVGKCLKSIVNITSNFDVCSDITTVHGYHTKKDKTENIKKLIGQLEESKVLEDIPNQYHKGFT